MSRRILVLLSGGLDSAALLYQACRMVSPRNVEAITFDYGQQHHRELLAAKVMARSLLAWNNWQQLNLAVIPEIVQSRLTGNGDNDWVPGRNLIFVSVAVAYAMTHRCQEILLGSVAADIYPDNSTNFVKTVNATVQETFPGHTLGVSVPLKTLSKRQVIELIPPGLARLTHSCYAGVWPPCGECKACKDRELGYAEAGIPDPLLVAETDPLLEESYSDLLLVSDAHQE